MLGGMPASTGCHTLLSHTDREGTTHAGLQALLTSLGELTTNKSYLYDRDEGSTMEGQAAKAARQAAQQGLPQGPVAGPARTQGPHRTGAFRPRRWGAG